MRFLHTISCAPHIRFRVCPKPEADYFGREPHVYAQFRGMLNCICMCVVLSCGVLASYGQSELPKLFPSNLSVFDINDGLPISCANDGMFDPAGRLWINPCFTRDEHRTISFYTFDGTQSTFVEWEGFPASGMGQAVLSGLMPTGELFGYFRGTSTCFFLDPDTQQSQFYSPDSNGIQIIFIGYTDTYGVIVHAISPVDHLVYRLDRDGLQLLMTSPRLDASEPCFPVQNASGYTVLTESDLWVLNVKSRKTEQQHIRQDFGALIRFQLADRNVKNYDREHYFSAISSQIDPDVPSRFQIARFGTRDSMLVYMGDRKQFFCFDLRNDTVRPFNPFQKINTHQLLSPYQYQSVYRIVNDEAGNVLFYFTLRTDQQAILLDRNGAFFDYSPVLDAAKQNSMLPGSAINMIYGRDLLKKVYLFMGGGVAVADLKFTGPISVCMEGIPVRAINEVAAGDYITYPESMGFALFKSDARAEGRFDTLVVHCLTADEGEEDPKHMANIIKDVGGNFWMPYNEQIVKFSADGSCSDYFVGEDFLKFTFVDAATVAFATDNALFLYNIPRQELTPLLTHGIPIRIHGLANQLYYTKDSILWVASLDGLHKVDLKTGAYRVIGRPDGFIDNRMMCIEEDASGRLWIGTYGGGLHIYDPKTEAVSVIDRNSGLSNNIVVGVLTDNAGVHWVSTYEGLNLVSPQGNVLSRLYKEDGLSTNEFNRYSFFKGSTGELLFGSIAGINIIQPNKVKAQLLESDPIQVHVTQISYYDARSDSLINKINWPYHAEVIRLSAAHRTISLQLALSSLVRIEENRFAYKLEGANIPATDKWTYIGTNKELNVQNLPAGRYNILVRGCDYRGNWTPEPIIIPVHASEFFYAKTWFIALCIAGFIGLILTWMLLQRMKRKQLERELKERTAEIMRTRDQLVVQEKLASLGQLTAGIAHEIKNPLNFINNFAVDSSRLADKISSELHTFEDAVQEDTRKKLTRYLEDMKQNALDIRSSGSTADRIVRSMMDHARGTSETMQMLDLNHIVQETVYLAVHGFKTRYPDFQVSVQARYDPKVQQLYGSPLNLSRALLNILNNACYALRDKAKDQTAGFQPKLILNTQLIDSTIEILIRDNGPGISPEIQKNIFKPFFTTKPTGEGNTGLGLSICYDIIVNEHRGQLDVRSQPGEYTEFIINLPV